MATVCSMTGWVVRGVGMALVHVVARVVLALAVAAAPTSGSMLQILTLIAVILVALVWGGLDGIASGRRGEHDDTDHTMVWLKASLIAGVGAGFLSWLFTAIANIAVSANTLVFEVTAGAAFTVLLVFVPAVIAVTIGRWWARRGTDDGPRRRSADPDERRATENTDDDGRGTDTADTEVFAPARDRQ